MTEIEVPQWEEIKSILAHLEKSAWESSIEVELKRIMDSVQKNEDITIKVPDESGENFVDATITKGNFDADWAKYENWQQFSNDLSQAWPQISPNMRTAFEQWWQLWIMFDSEYADFGSIFNEPSKLATIQFLSCLKLDLNPNDMFDNNDVTQWWQQWSRSGSFVLAHLYAAEKVQESDWEMEPKPDMEMLKSVVNKYLDVWYIEKEKWLPDILKENDPKAIILVKKIEDLKLCEKIKLCDMFDMSNVVTKELEVVWEWISWNWHDVKEQEITVLHKEFPINFKIWDKERTEPFIIKTEKTIVSKWVKPTLDYPKSKDKFIDTTNVDTSNLHVIINDQPEQPWNNNIKIKWTDKEQNLVFKMEWIEDITITIDKGEKNMAVEATKKIKEKSKELTAIALVTGKKYAKKWVEQMTKAWKLLMSKFKWKKTQTESKEPVALDSELCKEIISTIESSNNLWLDTTKPNTQAWLKLFADSKIKVCEKIVLNWTYVEFTFDDEGEDEAYNKGFKLPHNTIVQDWKLQKEKLLTYTKDAAKRAIEGMASWKTGEELTASMDKTVDVNEIVDQLNNGEKRLADLDDSQFAALLAG